MALRALEWMISQPGLAAIYLEASGATPADLRGRVEEPEFLASVLDFLLASDALVTGFAATAGIAPADILHARRRLPGGAELDWI